MGKSSEVLFRRYDLNPIITSSDLPYLANTVFNAGAIKFNEKILLLLRVEDRRGISHLLVAKSDDGITNWKFDDKPTFIPEPDKHHEEMWGVEDPRITYMEELKQWAVVYTAYSHMGPLVSLALTRDFVHFEKRGPIMPPEDKDAAIFPVRFNGRWALIHRPVISAPTASAHIWISFSPDLKHWGDHKVLIRAREGGWWDSKKVGLNTPPIKTDDGWLVMYHGVRETASGDVYRLGLALLDLEDPSIVRYRSKEWVLAPQEKYEREGDVENVIFPCGWVCENNDLKLYYGAADTSIALATARLDHVIEWLKETGERNPSCV